MKGIRIWSWGGSWPRFPGCPRPRRHWGVSVGCCQPRSVPAAPHLWEYSPLGRAGTSVPPISGVPQHAAFAQPCLQPAASRSRLLTTPALVKLGLACWTHWVRASPHSAWEQPPRLHQDPRGTKAEPGTLSPNVTRHGDPEFLKSEHPAPNPLQTLPWPNTSPQTGCWGPEHWCRHLGAGEGWGWRGNENFPALPISWLSGLNPFPGRR